MAKGVKLSDGAIICVTVVLMGAPYVLGEQVSHGLGVWLFWGGLIALVAFVSWKLTTGAWGGHDEEHANTGAFAGRDNTGIQQVFHGPVTIHARPALPPARTALLVSGQDNIFHNVEFEGFDRAIELSESARGNAFSNISGTGRQPVSAPMRDIWLQDGVCRALYGRWPAEDEQVFNNEGDVEKVEKISRQMREFAGDGKLTIWGKSDANRLPEMIPASYWVDHEIEFLRLFGISGKRLHRESDPFC